MSVKIHSGTFSDSTDTTSPRCMPSRLRATPTRRARSPYWAQVTERQMPKSFSRIAIESPRSPTFFQKSAGTVVQPSTS